MPMFGSDGKTGDGHTPEEFAEILKDNGYDDEDIKILFKNG